MPSYHLYKHRSCAQCPLQLVKVSADHSTARRRFLWRQPSGDRDIMIRVLQGSSAVLREFLKKVWLTMVRLPVAFCLLISGIAGE